MQNPNWLHATNHVSVFGYPKFIKVEPLRDEYFIKMQEQAEKVKNMLADLNLDVAQSANNQLLVIEMQKKKEVAVWKKMLDEKAIPEQQLAQARELINQKASNKIKNISEKEAKKLKKSASEIGLAMALSFESRGMDALLDGKYSDALKGIVRDLTEMTLRLLVLKPLTEKLFGNLEGGGILGGLLSSLGLVAGAKTGSFGKKSPRKFYRSFSRAACVIFRWSCRRQSRSCAVLLYGGRATI